MSFIINSYRFASGGGGGNNYTVAVPHATSSPYVAAYPFNTVSGFGAKYSNPATALPDSGYQCAWSPSGSYVASAHDGSPFVTVHNWSAGFGSKVANPGTLPTNGGRGVAWHPTGNDIAVAHLTTPFISVYPWAGGFGTKYSNPAVLPSGDGYAVAFSPSGTVIYIGFQNSPFIAAYPWNSGSGFGTKYADPATLAGNITYDIHSIGADVAIARTVSLYIRVSAWSTGWGISYSGAAANPPTGGGNAIRFAPSGLSVAMAHDTSPYVTSYPFTSGVGLGAKYSDPSSSLGSNGTGVDFTPDESCVILGSFSNGIAAYQWSPGFGTKFSNPASPPPGASRKLSIK